jgi:hypothetical protein
MVDLVGIEPTTSSMPWKRAPSCATGPLLAGQLFYCRGLRPVRQTLGDPPSRGSGPARVSLREAELGSRGGVAISRLSPARLLLDWRGE